MMPRKVVETRESAIMPPPFVRPLAWSMMTSPPSVAQLAFLRQIRKEFADRGRFLMIGFRVEEGRDAWGVRHWPEAFLIGPDGRLRDEVASDLRPKRREDKA
jgi:hypothetical protein